MKYILGILLLTTSIMAQDVPVEPEPAPPEKMYYTATGWFGPWPEVAIGESTPNGTPECEATILEDGMPVPRNWVKLAGDGKVFCPVEIDQTRKDEALAIIAVSEAIQAKVAQATCGSLAAAKIAVDLGNKDPALTIAQRKQFLLDFSDIFTQIKAGSIDLAISDMSLVVPDGTIVTDTDKVKYLAYINECL